MAAWAAVHPVGIIGADGDPANLLYAAVPIVTLVGAGMARFRPQGMAWGCPPARP